MTPKELAQRAIIMTLNEAIDCPSPDNIMDNAWFIYRDIRPSIHNSRIKQLQSWQELRLKVQDEVKRLITALDELWR